VTDRDVASIVQHGLSDEKIDLPHLDDVLVAQSIVDKVLTEYAQPRTFIRAAKLVTRKSESALDMFINAEIGKKFFVENSDLAITKGTSNPFILGTSSLDGSDELADESAVYVVHSMGFEIDEGNNIDATLGLFPGSIRL